MDFGEALKILKHGGMVSRLGWNGKGMYLFLLPAATVPIQHIHTEPLRTIAEENGGTVDCLGSIRMRTADGKILTGWLSSQTDMLAEDWVEVVKCSWEEEERRSKKMAVEREREEEIREDKALRRDGDALIQRVRALPPSWERSLAITKLQEAVMWLGMDLKRLNAPDPYPLSKDPSSLRIEPTADGLKL